MNSSNTCMREQFRGDAAFAPEVIRARGDLGHSEPCSQPMYLDR